MDFRETLTPNQEKIYDVVKGYLTKNPFFTLDDLYRFCKKNTPLPENEVHSILTQFVYKKLIIDGSKLTKDAILKNEIRNRIYKFISNNPALNFTQILKKFNIGSYAARWHLEMLRKFGFIRQKKIKIFNVYFTTDFPETKEEIAFSLRNPNALKIYLCLKHMSLNSNNLAQILTLNYSTIQYHIKDLFQNRLIITNGSNNFVVNPEFTDFLKRFYDLTVPQDLINRCDDFSREKGKGSPPLDIEFEKNIQKQFNILTTHMKQLQDNQISQQNLSQTLEKLENRLLTIEEEMRKFSEIFNKIKESKE